MPTLIASSRRNPCPVCGRVKDGDCRFHAGLILCHLGSSHGPDTRLQLGDVIQLRGQPWALVSKQAGHTGSAFAFRPHQALPDRGQHRPPNTRHRSTTASQQWGNYLKQFFDAFDLAWQLPDFYNADPAELKFSFQLVADAQNKAAFLAGHLATIWRNDPALEQQFRLRVEQCLKTLRYVADDVERFRRAELGEREVVG